MTWLPEKKQLFMNKFKNTADHEQHDVAAIAQVYKYIDQVIETNEDEEQLRDWITMCIPRYVAPMSKLLTCLVENNAISLSLPQDKSN